MVARESTADKTGKDVSPILIRMTNTTTASTTNVSRKCIVPVLVGLALFSCSREWHAIHHGIPNVNSLANVEIRDNFQASPSRPHRNSHFNLSKSRDDQNTATIDKEDSPEYQFDVSGVNYRNIVSAMTNYTMPVFILPIAPGTECPNEIYDEGTMYSNSIQLIRDSNSSLRYPHVTWIHQATWNRHGSVCYPELIQEIRNFYFLATNSTSTTNMTQFRGGKIHVFDWFDNPDRLPRCQNMEDLVGLDNVYHWKRSIVQGRRWNNMTQSIEIGHITTHLNRVPVKFLPFAVRSNVVDEIRTYVLEHFRSALGNETTSNSDLTNVETKLELNASALTDYLVTKDRPGDVVHYWPVNGSKGGLSRGSPDHDNSVLRTVTSQTLLELSAHPYHVPQVLCDVRGVAGRRGRAGVTTDYVESMLDFKIIVVVQRDDWEGHFRLLEAMVSGAMVIHDRIVALPLGLKENVNIVFFDSMEELKEKIIFYLNHTHERMEIARRGRQLAMCHHRSWHRMEQVIFGHTVTPCDE